MFGEKTTACSAVGPLVAAEKCEIVFLEINARNKVRLAV
jgi:hypothetical protein